ncbi:hypothetical protein LWI29_024650 [Acer saccharum]|uniref:C2 domain-containing protein n=1 Tax=Acer saccharum TaxID=4024 RepID=A0AA39T6D2_ACESA|nr:hypothetical protein LWI29_017827 [Acer saccharum]KAK0601478.1 hypothetical protein LWI29_024650 [Acer saccharum]
MVAPPRVLEINVLSAHDLALVSKTMKTYAVAWVDPERKLTTRVDQTGLDSPAWNDKFVFRVDDRFLTDETSAIMIEIYAAAWVKDALIGTVKVLTSHLFGSLLNTTSTTRYVALQVRRPSGRPQGILNLGVTLLDNTMRSMPLFMELCTTGGNFSDINEDYTSNNVKTQQQKVHKDDQDLERSSKAKNKTNPNAKLLRSQSDKTDLTSEDYFKQDCPKQPPQGDSLVGVGLKGSGGSMINESLCSSDVGPSASVVAAAIAKGLYKVPVPTKAPAGNGGGGMITTEWTEKEIKEEELKSKLERWKTELPPIYDHSKIRANSKQGGRARRRSDNGGLFSCFGNAFGCEISITCGGGSKKKNNGKVCNLSSVDGSSVAQSSSYV